MTAAELLADVSSRANRAGLYFAFLQLVFTLGSTTYLIYLPKLAAEVGIAPGGVILILMLDQAIFTITDTARWELPPIGSPLWSAVSACSWVR
jgi:hypothetical protein